MTTQQETAAGQPAGAWSDEERDRFVALHREMTRIRRFEELIQSLFLKGEVYGTTHLYNGQEAVAVGVSSVLDERDRVSRAHIAGTVT